LPLQQIPYAKKYVTNLKDVLDFQHSEICSSAVRWSGGKRGSENYKFHLSLQIPRAAYNEVHFAGNGANEKDIFT